LRGVDAGFVDEDELLRGSIRQRAEYHLIEDGEHGRRGANAEREGRQGEGGESRVSHEKA
jgi:hypothetical protein